jgi:hypothetical protein
MLINEGLFIGLDGRTFIRHVHAAVARYQLGSPESQRYERTTRLDPDGRVIFQQQPLLSTAERGLRPEQSGGAGTAGGQEVFVPPHRTPTTPAPR